jgi:hypothetical protein
VSFCSSTVRAEPLCDLAGTVDARRGGRENRRVSETSTLGAAFVA